MRPAKHLLRRGAASLLAAVLLCTAVLAAEPEKTEAERRREDLEFLYQTVLVENHPNAFASTPESEFLALKQEIESRLETESVLREMGVDVEGIRVAVEVRSTESIKQMVSEGLGIAVISQSACEDYCKFKKLLAFNFDSVKLRRKLYLVRHKNSILSPIAQTFYDYAAGYYNKDRRPGQ